MTNRVQNLTVILDRDMRDDDVQYVVDAIKMIKCVAKVKLDTPVHLDDCLARQRVSFDLGDKIIDVIRNHRKD